MGDRKSTSVYKGKGFVLIGADKEFIDNAKKKKKKKKKKKNINEGKEGIFSKFNPVASPLLNQRKNRKEESEEKGRKNVKELNVLNEDEINSFLLRNKAFRLAWKCIIEKVQEEIYIEVSKNLKSVFDEIYLYSISNNQYLPLILITAGTNIADHELIIDTLYYTLKEWKYKNIKNEDKDFEMLNNIKKNKKFKIKGKRKTRNINEEKHKTSILDKLNDENYETEESTENNDMCVCSLNSSTSNNINAAIFNIYEQLLREYKKRYIEKKNKEKLNRKRRSSSTVGNAKRSKRKINNNINDSLLDINILEKELAANIEEGKDVEGEDTSIHKKVISVDKLINLYIALSELERKEDSSSEESNSEEDEDYDDEHNFHKKFMHKNFQKFELYNETSNYFNDGRKKIRVIILIHDCEYFNVNILNGILNVLINLRIDNKICLSVILGVSTPSFFFNRITNPDTQSKLRIKTIDILNNKLICENICNGIIFDNILPFIINFRTIMAIRLLLHKNNQSISHLINILYILIKEFYDNNLFSFLCLPVNYYLLYNEEDEGQIQGESVEDIFTEYSPYTYVRSYQKCFKNYSKYDIRNLHKKIICLCYSANIYYRHLAFIKKKYSSVLVKGYFDLYKFDSPIHTPSHSDNEGKNDFTLKRAKTKNSQKIATEMETITDVKHRSNSNTEKPENAEENKTGEFGGETKNECMYENSSLLKGNETEYETSVKKEAEAVKVENAQMGTFEIETTEFDTSVEKDTNIEKDISVEESITGKKKKAFNLSTYAWQFKANTINWWLDHPFKDLVFTYEFPKPKGPLKRELTKNIKEELVEEEEAEAKKREKEQNQTQLFDINNVKEINKILCETFLPKSVLQLIERKYAFTIAINLISIILKTKSEYNNSTKRFEYFRKLFENYEKVKWTENKSILYIEKIYKMVEMDVKKCINFLIEIISPYYFKNHNVILKMLKEFKKYYTNVYPIVYNVETYLYMLKQKENEKENEIFVNDDFSRSCANYSVTFSIYYSLLFKLDNIIEMLRRFINEQKASTFVNTSSKIHSSMKSKNILPKSDNTQETKNAEIEEKKEDEEEEEEEEEYKNNTSYLNNIENENDSKNIYNRQSTKTSKEKVFARYLTMENPLLKKQNEENKNLGAEDISDVLNMFLHDYLYLLLLPPIFYHPLAYELIIHKPDKDFTEFMARDIKSEILTTLSYTNPYKTGNLMCSCCFSADPPENVDINTNITCNQKIYLNPYYDNISTLEDLVNIYRIYERCDKFLGYSIEATDIFENASESKEHLFSEMLQEYYLRFIIAVSTFCSFFKILKPPNVSALLNYEDNDCLPENYNSKDGHSSETSVAKFLSEIRKSLQGCTSKKLLFGKYYYNKTIISREFFLMQAVQAIPDLDAAEEAEEEEADGPNDLQHKTGGKRRKKV